MRGDPVKGFAWTGFIAPVNGSGDSKTIIKGNFVMDLVLPNALKINSFMKIRQRLHDYEKSHAGRVPDRIIVNKRQYREYQDLFPGRRLFVHAGATRAVYAGIPLYIHDLR